MRLLVGVLLLLACSAAASAGDPLVRLNARLSGRVVDFTNNHGADRRIESAILCQRRDLYVYLPPCYDPNQAYSVVYWLHGAFGDESSFIVGGEIAYVDRLIASGCCPPFIVVAPDGTYDGVNRLWSQHSFWVNGIGGAYEDFMMQELIPFIESNFSIRPERQAHGLIGLSAGGFGAVSLAIKYREYFKPVAALAAPVNLRYWNVQGNYFANFSPQTFRWRTAYWRRETVGRFALGVVRIRGDKIAEAVFGPPEEALARVIESNPADLLSSHDLQPGELDIYLRVSKRDNFNFDAHNASFAWLARQRCIAVTLIEDNCGQHLTGYFLRAQKPAFRWMCGKILPPIAIIETEVEVESPAEPSIQAAVPAAPLKG